MKKITNEDEYIKALEDLEKLQVSKRSDAKKKMDALYELIEEWEINVPKEEVSRLEALKDELALYTEEEIKVFSVMAMKLLEYKKNVQNGIKATMPKFDPDLYNSMREWAKLRADIHAEEAKLKK